MVERVISMWLILVYNSRFIENQVFGSTGIRNYCSDENIYIG